MERELVLRHEVLRAEIDGLRARLEAVGKPKSALRKEIDALRAELEELYARLSAISGPGSAGAA